MHPGKPCQHCTQQGCAIYETRPQDPCVNFECAWLKEPGQIPENMRPDLCGAIITRGGKWKGEEIITATPTGEEIPTETLDWLMAYARQLSLPLVYFRHVMSGDNKLEAKEQMNYGPLWFMQTVANEILPEDVTRM
jgi:hypothetical protein